MANEEVKGFSLDAVELQKYQPNRYPFLMIDRVTEVVPGKYAKGFKNLTNNEWYFPKHFPGNPNMPGCLQIEAMAQMLTVAIMTCEGMEGKVAHGYKDNATFHEEVKPGDRLEMDAQVLYFKRGLCKGYVKGFVDGKLVCELDTTIIIPDVFSQFRPKKA
jgi:3-hydroxyacyl-[acyl-carrier-protein] dehydratase